MIAIVKQIRHLARRLKHILDWSIFLWKDYDWSWGYIFTILAYKIKRTRIELENSKFHNHGKKRLRKMKICEQLLLRVADESYIYGKIWDDYEKKFYHGKPTIDDLVRKPMSEEQRQYLRKMDEYEQKMIDQDLDLFWKIFKSQYRYWWD